MARVTVSGLNLRLEDSEEISRHLAGIGIDYERWEATRPLDPKASAAEILDAYAGEIERLKERGGYVVADVVELNAQTQGLDVMLDKFKREHWHDEDEVRFVIHGHGVFYIRPRAGALTAVEVEAGDLLRVPRGTWHWFTLCDDREIRTIRLFQDPSGWTPRYTDSGADEKCQPVCLGPEYFGLQAL